MKHLRMHHVALSLLAISCVTATPLSLTAATVPLAAAPLAADTDLSGRWVLLQVNASVASVPVVGDVTATTRAVSLLDLQHRGERLQGKGRVCEVRVDSGSSLVKTVLPRALLEALPAPRLDARLHERDGRTLFHQPRQTVVLGAALKKPAREPLPGEIADPRVRDHDRDGHPGVTVRVEGIVDGELYVVQRSWSELRGHRTKSGFAGGVRFGNEQVVLEATSWMLGDPPPSRPDPGRSYFRLERMDGDCARARRIAAGWSR